MEPAREGRENLNTAGGETLQIPPQWSRSLKAAERRHAVGLSIRVPPEYSNA
jgi:hypothetical protein